MFELNKSKDFKHLSKSTGICLVLKQCLIMRRVTQLIATIFILLITVSLLSKGYKAFKKSDFYKGTNSYKKKLEIRKDGEEHFKKLQKKN